MGVQGELYATCLTLRPPEPGLVLPHSGRAVQGWWLDWLRGHDPALAAALHEGSERRQYTCSGLIGVPTDRPGTRVPVSPERTYEIRLTTWAAPVAACLRALVATPPRSLTIGRTIFQIEAAMPDPALPPATFAGLAARHLWPASSSETRPADMTLRFLTATSFRQADTLAGRPPPLPFPLPAHVWGSLFDRWQAVAPIHLEMAAGAALAARVGVGRFAGESQRVLVSGVGDPAGRVGATGGQWVVGFVGRCTYWWPRDDGYLGGVVRLLAAFAEYAGVGHGTAYGLGQVRAVWPPARTVTPVPTPEEQR